MLFRSPALGACCCLLPTREGRAAVWIHTDHSCFGCRFMYDDIHDRWMHYSNHIVPVGEVCTVPGQCASDYIDWFFRISHPFKTPSHTSDPPQPRVIPQAPQTDIPHVSEPGAPSTSARLAEEPRHAVVSNTNNLRHLHQYFHNNLCNLFVLYLTESLPWDC